MLYLASLAGAQALQVSETYVSIFHLFSNCWKNDLL